MAGPAQCSTPSRQEGTEHWLYSLATRPSHTRAPPLLQVLKLDLPAFVHRVLVLGPGNGCPRGVSRANQACLEWPGPCYAYINRNWLPGGADAMLASILHELSHNVGLMHSQRAGSANEYGDASCIMGMAPRLTCMNAAQAWALGWATPQLRLTSQSMPFGAWLPGGGAWVADSERLWETWVAASGRSVPTLVLASIAVGSVSSAFDVQCGALAHSSMMQAMRSFICPPPLPLTPAVTPAPTPCNDARRPLAAAPPAAAGGGRRPRAAVAGPWRAVGSQRQQRVLPGCLPRQCQLRCGPGLGRPGPRAGAQVGSSCKAVQRTV